MSFLRLSLYLASKCLLHDPVSVRVSRQLLLGMGSCLLGDFHCTRPSIFQHLVSKREETTVRSIF